MVEQVIPQLNNYNGNLDHRRGMLLLGFFLVLLLVNFLVFSNYHSANLELAGK